MFFFYSPWYIDELFCNCTCKSVTSVSSSALKVLLVVEIFHFPSTPISMFISLFLLMVLLILTKNCSKFCRYSCFNMLCAWNSCRTLLFLLLFSWCTSSGHKPFASRWNKCAFSRFLINYSHFRFIVHIRSYVLLPTLNLCGHSASTSLNRFLRFLVYL